MAVETMRRNDTPAAGAGMATLVDATPKPAVAVRPRVAVLASRFHVYVADGCGVYDMSLREFLAQRRLPRRDADILLPFSAPVPVRARLLTGRHRVLFVPYTAIPTASSTRDVLREMLTLPEEDCVPSTRNDEAIAVLTLLYRRHQAVSGAVKKHKHWIAAARHEWPPVLRDLAGEWAGSALPHLVAERDAMRRALQRYLRAYLSDLLDIVAPPGPRGRGIGPVSASAVITYIVHPARFPNVRALLHYAGLGVKDGRAVRIRRGEASSFSPAFKAALWEVVRMGWGMESASNSYWKSMYIQNLEYCERNHTISCSHSRCNAGKHVSMMAWRRVLQRYLAEVYLGWRALLIRRGGS